jgi:hypothetical protein
MFLNDTCRENGRAYPLELGLVPIVRSRTVEGCSIASQSRLYRTYLLE